MTKYQQMVEEQCRYAREWASCLSSICSRDVVWEGTCEKCKDAAEESLRKTITRDVNEAIRALRYYGFTVEEN